MRLCLVIVLVFYMSAHVRLVRYDHIIYSVLFCIIVAFSVPFRSFGIDTLTSTSRPIISLISHKDLTKKIPKITTVSGGLYLFFKCKLKDDIHAIC